MQALEDVQLGGLLSRLDASSDAAALDADADWAGVLSLGEQQRLAFARSCLSASIAELLGCSHAQY